MTKSKSSLSTGFLSPRNDFVFKLLLGDQRNIGYLANFLQSILSMPPEEFDRLVIVDPHVKREFAGDKAGILDVKVFTRSGKAMHVEIQVVPIPGMWPRILYYSSKLCVEQLKSGSDYASLNQTICIIITDFVLVKDSAHFHNRFVFCDRATGAVIPDSPEIHVLELPKLPKESDGTQEWNWLKFLSSETRQDLDEMAERGVVMSKVVGTLLELSENETTRMLAEAREKERRDWASRMQGSLAEGLSKGLRKGRAEGEAKGLTKGREEGMAKGREEGMAKGREEGMAKGREEKARIFIQNSLRKGMALADIADIVELPLAEVKRLAALPGEHSAK